MAKCHCKTGTERDQTQGNIESSWTDMFGSLLLKYGSNLQSERISHVLWF